MNVYIAAIVGHGAVMARLGMARRDPHLMAIGPFVLAFIGSTLLFARVNEVRVFLIYTPVLVFSAALFAEDVRRLAARPDGQPRPESGAEPAYRGVAGGSWRASLRASR